MVEVVVKETSLAISGTILDTSGKPVPDVTVQLVEQGAIVREVMTDANGLYAARDLRPASYTLRPSYQVKQAFSVTTQTLEAVAFDPRSRIVQLTDRDQPGTDFTMTPP